MIKPVFETLENRVLLSGAPSDDLNAVDVLWHGRTLRAVENEYVVKTRGGRDFNKLVDRLNLPVEDIKDLGGGFYKFESDARASKISRWTSTYKKYLSALTPNRVYEAAAIPNDPNYAGNQWYLNNTGQSINGRRGTYTATPGIDIDAEEAWDLVNSDTEVDPTKQIVIAVLDTGIDLNHPDLVDNIFQNPGEIPNNDFDDDANGYVDDANGWNAIEDNGDPTDGHGHGTHVSGTIGAVGNNSEGISGAIWNVKILPVRVLGDTGFATSDSIVVGIRYIARLKEQGFNVVAANASLGGSEFPFDEIESRAVEQLGERNVLFLAAAGNDSSNIDPLQDFPSKYSLNLPNVITVAATDALDELSDFSNFGAASVTVAAPGEDIFSTTPTYPVFLTLFGETTPTYGYLSGTSMATPVATGIIALEAALAPNASMAQLKNALIKSVEIIPSLASVNSLPPKVSTGGRVNALRALKFLQNELVAQNNTRQGNWQGAYGAQGAYIVGESTSFPGFVTGQITGDSSLVNPSVSSTSSRALQGIADPSSRVIAYQATTTTTTIDLNFTDGLEHRVGIYMVDIDRRNRTQVVNLVDAASGIVTDSRTISKFTKGQYLFWDVKGHVQIQITRVKGPNAVFSGVFFDTPPSDDSVFFGSDTSTSGKWTNRYGSQGAFVIGETPAFPSFVIVTPAGKTDVVTDDTTRNSAALQKPTNLGRGIIAAWTSTSFFDFNLSFLDGKTHRTSFYFHDHNNKHRETRVEVYDETGTTLMSRVDINNFRKGIYLTFDLVNNVKIRVTNLSGPDAGVHGIFFDATPIDDIQFTGTDSTTRGKWRRTRYGTVTQLIAGVNTIDQFNASQTIADVTSVLGEISTVITDAHTRNATALQYPTNANDGISAYFENVSTFTLDINLLDNRTHRMAAYFVDPTDDRHQRVEVIDAQTGQTLSSTELRDFSDGKYLIWNVRGHIQIKVTTYVPESAILSGLFFD